MHVVLTYSIYTIPKSCSATAELDGERSRASPSVVRWFYICCDSCAHLINIRFVCASTYPQICTVVVPGGPLVVSVAMQLSGLVSVTSGIWARFGVWAKFRIRWMNANIWIPSNACPRAEIVFALSRGRFDWDLYRFTWFFSGSTPNLVKTPKMLVVVHAFVCVPQ